MNHTDTTPGYRAALHIIERLADAGHQALITGGTVRDMIMGQSAGGDIDIATDARPEEVTSLFPHTVAVGAKFGVVVVVERGFSFEVATFRSDDGIDDGRHPAAVEYTDARHDALRRDFTINGLFFDTGTKEVLDYVDGKSDIENRVIRAIGEPSLRFREDYLRMLRAIRFAARFDFIIEERTWKAIICLANGITAVSMERIFTELDKMFRSPHADRALELLDRSQLLALVIPEVSALKGIAQPPQFHPEGDVFEHTKKALGLLGADPSPGLAWSVLLHDIGKPRTMSITDRIRFNNHDKEGMLLAESVLRRLRSSNALIEEVTASVGNHMNFMQVRNMRLGTLKRFLSRPTIETELELHRIDCLASHGNCDNYHFLREKLRHFKSETLKPEPLLRGRDLIGLGFTPGPLFGKILAEIYELQLEEEVSTREQAISFVTSRYHVS